MRRWNRHFLQMRILYLGLSSWNASHFFVLKWRTVAKHVVVAEQELHPLWISPLTPTRRAILININDLSHKYSKIDNSFISSSLKWVRDSFLFCARVSCSSQSAFWHSIDALKAQVYYKRFEIAPSENHLLDHKISDFIWCFYQTKDFITSRIRCFWQWLLFWSFDMKWLCAETLSLFTRLLHADFCQWLNDKTTNSASNSKSLLQ